MTIEAWLRGAETRLSAAGLDSPRLEAEWLLAHVLGLPRMQLTLQSRRELSSTERETVDPLLERRSCRVPSQHLIGTAAFLHHELIVDRRVLVPRSETEGLALLAIQHLRQSLQEKPNVQVLDFGTGSGALILSIAAELPSIEVHALDISADALEVARLNARRLGLSDRVCFHQSDRFRQLPPGLQFDLMVANPPYIPTQEIETLAPEVREFDPKLALDGGSDGLDFYRYLASEAGQRLIPGGCLLLELGFGQSHEVTELFRKAGWTHESVEKDLSGIERVLIVRCPEGSDQNGPQGFLPIHG
jgi:release factor glutamine methyltransferase